MPLLGRGGMGSSIASSHTYALHSVRSIKHVVGSRAGGLPGSCMHLFSPCSRLQPPPPHWCVEQWRRQVLLLNGVNYRVHL